MPLSEGFHLKLGSLPPEIITKIMEEFDWFSLMNVRKTCRYLCDISKSLAVWQRQLQRYVSGHKIPARLEAPLDTFTASELEDWVTRRVSADAGWKSANRRRPTGIRKINRSVRRACLVPGGRWLLIGGRDGTLIAYDLDAPGVQGRLLLELPDRRIESMCVSIDKDSPNFAFNIAISSNSDYLWGDHIHIWTVSINGRGRGAYLQARLLHDFRAPTISIQAFNLTLRNNLVARILHGGNGVCHVEVFNWLNTVSTSHCKQVIQFEEIHHVQLLPGDRLLIFTEGYIRVYDVQPIVSRETSSIADPVILPRWQLPCPQGHRTATGGISEALIDTFNTQFTFVAENPNTIYGLNIPHDVSQLPILRKIAHFPGEHYPAIAVGFEKMFVAFERNWKADRDKLSGSEIRLGIPWMEKGISFEVSAVQGVHSYEYPTEWYVGWPPLLDEGSGRIVQPFGKKGLLVVDTALCCQ